MSDFSIEPYLTTPPSDIRFEGQVANIHDSARIMLGGDTEGLDRTEIALVGEYAIFATEEIDRLRLASQTDFLTGLRNRSALAASFYEHGTRAATHGRAFVSMFVDLDKLKIVNDKYGHIAGDAYLQVAAYSLRQWAANDFEVFRWGGDEFSLVGSIPYAEETEVMDAKFERNRSGLQRFTTSMIRNACEDDELSEQIGTSVGGLYVSPGEVKEVLFALGTKQSSMEEIVELVHDEADRLMYLDKPRDNREVYENRPQSTPFSVPVN